MYKIGIVQKIDTKTWKVIVKFNPKDEITYTMDILQKFTKVNRTFWLPDIGEQVVCLMDERMQSGVILGSLFATEGDKSDIAAMKKKLPEGAAISSDLYYQSFSDGTCIMYDRKKKKLTIEVKGTVEETFEGEVTRTYKDKVTETFEKERTIPDDEKVTFSGASTQTVTKDLTIEVKGNVTIKSGKKVTVKGGGEVSISGSKVKINDALEIS
nr:hypothetical protein 8 [bacterium]